MKSATWLALAAMLGFGAAAEANDKPEGGDRVRAGGQAKERPSGEARPAPQAREHAQPRVQQDEGSERKSEPARMPTGAELRHPRAGTGHGDRDREWRYGYHDYRPYNRYRYGYWNDDAYWAPYYYGYGYGYGYGSGYGGYGAPRYTRYTREAGALRLRVEPEDTQVFVDGYYAGVVDDFDGVFQRLYLSPGRHRITLRLDGHRSHVFGIYVPIDQTLKLHHRMVPGDGEDRADFTDDDRASLGPQARSAVASPVETESWGTLRVDVQPVDASVYVDGEFRGTARELRSLKLPAGMHKVEIVRPGFRTVEKDASVEADQVAEVATELEKN